MNPCLCSQDSFITELQRPCLFVCLFVSNCMNMQQFIQIGKTPEKELKHRTPRSSQQTLVEVFPWLLFSELEPADLPSGSTFLSLLLQLLQIV